jgi:hypothetical protein
MRRLTLTAAVALVLTGLQLPAATAGAARTTDQFGYHCALTGRLPAGAAEGLGCQPVGGAPASGPVTRPFFITDVAGGRLDCDRGRVEPPNHVVGENCVRTR